MENAAQIITINPTEKSGGREGKSPSGPRNWVLPPDRFLTDTELDRLLSTARERRDAGLLRGTTHAVRDCTLVVLLAKSGLRIGEACRLVWADVQLRAAEGRPPAILVRRGKGGKARVVPIGDELRRELKAWRKAAEARGRSTADDAPVFPSQRGGHLTVSAAERVVAGAMKRAGIPGKRNPHRLRHSFASKLYRVSKDLRLVQRVLGHSRVDTTCVYVAVCDQDVHDAVNRI